MALLHRLFSSKKTQKEVWNTDQNKSNSWKPFHFDKDQVRVLLFRECDWRGRKLLFDSKAVNRITLENHSGQQKNGYKMKSNANLKLENYVEITDGYGYQYVKPSSDTVQLGEMVFGSVAMSFQGSTLKVHQLKSPTRVMCTKVFSTVSRYPYNGNFNERSLEDSFGSSIHSMNEYLSANGSNSNSKLGTWSFKGTGPVDVPACSLPGKSTGGSLEIDSGIYGNASLHSNSSIGSENNFNCGSSVTYPTCVYSRQNSGSFVSHASGCSEGSFGCLRRRWSHTINMSLEHCTNSSSCSENTSSSYKQNTKLGLAVLITFAGDNEMDKEIFFFEHMILVENIVERLRCSVEHAYIRKDMFVHLMMKGSEKLQQWLEDLFSAPRLSNPLWLRLTSSPKAETSTLVLSFIEDLCYLVANMDTKDTNFFISTLLTAVLTHHLGWVSTVLPEKMMPLSRCKDPCPAKLLKVLALSHPYNPLWAQLGDLCGALGHPTKIARTIVTGASGKKVEMLDKILTSLTYFIRCGEISKKTSSRCSRDQEDCLLKTSLVQSLPQVMKFKTGSFSTLVMDISSDYSEKANSQKTTQDLIPNPCEVEPSIDLSFSEGGRDLETNSEEILVQNADGVLSEQDMHAGSIGVDCSLLIEQVKELETQHNDLCQSVNGNILNRALLTRIHLPVNHSKYPSLNLNGDGLFNTSINESKSDSKILEHLATNIVNSSKSLFYNANKSETLGFQSGEVKYPDLFMSASAELGEYNRSVKENVSQQVLDQKEVTYCREKSTASTGGMKRTSKVMSNLSNTSLTADTRAAHKEYSKIYPSLAELLLLERGSGLIIDETDSVVQDINSGYLNDLKPTLSRNIASPSFKAESSITVPCESNVQRKPAVAALSQFDMYIPKKVENERQISSAVTMVDSITSRFGNLEIVEKCSNKCDENTINTMNASVDSSGIVFLIGDEQLVGLKNTVHNGDEYSHNRVCVSDSSFVKDTIKNPRSFCEGCLTSEITNVCCDYSFLTKVPKDLVNEPDTAICSCKDSTKQFSFQTDRYNIVTVCSSCVQSENENSILEKKQSVGIPHLSKCASFRSLNTLSNQECVEDCSNKSYLLQDLNRCECKQSSNFKNNCKNVFKCISCKSDLNIRILRERTKQIESVSKEVGLEDCEDLCAKRTHLCNCFQLAVGNCMGNSSLSGLMCCKCTAAQNSCSFKDSSHHLSHGSFTSEESKGGFVPPFHKDQSSFVELPLLKSVAESNSHKFHLGLAFSLLGATCDHYASDLILQGCTQNTEEWQMTLRKDLSFVAHHMFLDQEVSEAVCIVGNTDTWEVQLVSSHTYVVDKPGLFGVRVGMSQLVANMLESLLNLWKMHTPPEHCLLYLESKLREMCLRSQALAELLLKTDFCDMEKLTVTLDLEANDVPLLLAVASTHTPQVTQRYGLCFR